MYKIFWGSVGKTLSVGIPWGLPQVFPSVLGGHGDFKCNYLAAPYFQPNPPPHKHKAGNTQCSHWP